MHNEQTDKQTNRHSSLYMSYQSYTGGRSYNFVKNIDEVITLIDKLDKVITLIDKIDKVITLIDKIDKVITLSQKNCRSYFLQQRIH